MRKIKLAVESVDVESFEVAPAHAPETGTVAANEATPTCTVDTYPPRACGNGT